MKPVSVRFQCFGPYMDEQFIDFGELEKNGLFLICGETGAGKTTILDAMCYALYGESSGGQRGDMENMRCKLADKSQETAVEFIFDSLGNRYKFSRSLKYKTKNLHSYHNCYIWKDGVWEVLDTGLRQVSAQAERLVGLTSSQFRQVIILPQGKFEEFLVSDSKKKEEILVTLFNVQQWGRICEEIGRRVNSRAAVLNQEKTAITEGLRRYRCENIEDLALQETQLEQSLEETKLLAAEAATALTAAEDALASGKVDDEAFGLLNRLQQRLDQLKLQEAAMAAECQVLAQADEAERLRPAYEAYRSAAAAEQKAKSDLSAGEIRLERASAALHRACEELTAHEAQAALHAKNQKILLRLEQAREVYASLDALSAEVGTAQKAYNGAESALRAAEGDLENRDRDLAGAFEAQDQAKTAYDQAQIIYRRSIGGILAQTLETGKACPVCGSTSHPDPARMAEDHVSEAQLDKLNKELGRCGKAVSTAMSARSKAEKAKNSALDLLTAARQKLDSARERLELAQSQQIKGIESALALEQNIRAFTQRIQSYDSRSKLLLDGKAAAEGAHTAAELAIADCRTQLAAAEESLGAQRQSWEQALGASVFREEQAFLAASMDPARKQKRYQALTTWQADRKAAGEALEEQRQRLEGRSRPDLGQLIALRDAAKKNAAALSEKQILDTRRLKEMTADRKKLAARLEANRDALTQLEADQVFARRLSGHSGVGLQRYVLGVMMNSITAQANRLLEHVYGGRYRLYRTDETTGRTLKGGLELEVSDSQNSQRRSVRTLSGGEKFLVALSLAIGLSTVVQAQGEGIRLEAMFIDEGFGSLDREAIQDALDILQSIRSTAGVVGIISHVELLAETIPAQLQITKGKNGSRCTLVGL